MDPAAGMQGLQTGSASWLADVKDVAWAPDSRRLAVLTETRLGVLDIDSRSFATWPVSVPNDARLVGWRYDGQAVYLQTSDNVLAEADAAGHLQFRSEPAQYPGISYVPSPDGPVVVRSWIGNITGKFHLIGGKGAWEGVFLNWSPGSRYLSYRDETVTHLIDLQTGEDRALPWRGTPIWQPGGEQFLLVTGQGMRIMDVTGQVLATVPDVHEATWSADSRRILFSDTEGLWTVNADGSNRQLLTRAEKRVFQGEMVWLAQDELVYPVMEKTGGGGTSFSLARIAGGKIGVLDSGVRPDVYVSPDRRHVAYVAGPPVDSGLGDLVVYPSP